MFTQRIQKPVNRAASFVLALALLLVFASVVAAGGRPLSTSLSGAAEVPGPGDPDGTGMAHITLNQGQGQICFDITVENIEPATAAHIHLGDADESGPVVVNFMIDTNGLSGCVHADAQLIKQIRQNPDAYYVNVHNAEYPGGAVRGQLSK
jgi:hypothetical protein